MATQKLDRTKFIFKEKVNETLIKPYGELNGYNFNLNKLKNCTVYVMDWTKGMFIDNCENCTIFCGPCEGSVFIRTSSNCTFYVVAKQLRFRTVKDCTVYAYVPSDPALEDSVNVTFAPFNYMFPKAKELFEAAQLEKNNNRFDCVYDFSEKENPDQVHFTMQPENEFTLLRLDPNVMEGDCEHLFDEYPSHLASKFTDRNIINLINESASQGVSDTNFGNSGGFNQGFQGNQGESGFDFFGGTQNNEQKQVVKSDGFANQANPFDDADILITADDPHNHKSQSQSNYVINANANANANSNFDNDFFGGGNIQGNLTQPGNNESLFVGNTNYTNNFGESNRGEMISNSQIDLNNIHVSVMGDNNIDLEEQEAIRLQELQNQRRMEKIRMKMEKEIQMKNEIRNKANGYLEKWITNHLADLEKKKAQYKQDELVFLEERKTKKKDNPYDLVVDLIDLKDSEYKGTKDVTRMKGVIVLRREDFNRKLGKK